MKTFVIAEAGISHDGDLQKAFKLIDCAREAKADAVKFQTFDASKLVARRKQDPKLIDILKPYEMPLTWLPQLKAKCDEAGIEFMTTCFDEETIRIVAPFVKRFKIGHGEAHDFEFYMKHVPFGKPVIASITSSKKQGWADQSIETSYLFTVSSYPAPLADLAGIEREECDGYSDHTRDIFTGMLAVAAGAKIVEVHFCHWETNHDNLDRPVSLSPSQLIMYVELIRHAEKALYGVDSEESTKPGHPESGMRTCRQHGSAGSDPSDVPPVVTFGIPRPGLPLPRPTSSQSEGPRA